MTIMMVVIIILSNMVMMVMKIIFSIMVIIVVMAIIFMVHARITYSSRRASIAAAWVTAGSSVSSVRSISRIAADTSMYAVIWVASIHAKARVACALHAIARIANTKALIMTTTRSAIHMSCISHIHSLLHIGYSPEYENIL
ncbi:hypothetical protein I33_0775 [Bacillus subtilis subsp. subtilis str. RO-NN-1]|nr:hypothetical protein I33_0775 [Bacillus subtilis subsp. subtilis str. RO-NN-1]